MLGLPIVTKLALIQQNIFLSKGTPQKVFQKFGNVFHVYLIRGLQKYARNINLKKALLTQNCFEINNIFHRTKRKTVKIKTANVTKEEECKTKLPRKKIVNSKKKSKVSNYKEMIPFPKSPMTKNHLNKAKTESELGDAFFEKALSKVRPEFCFSGLQG